MRCATTTLYDYLARHPDISMSREKETDFFVAEKSLSLGPDWYRGQFDPARKLWGEASPNYTKGRDFPGVPARIKAFCPDVRLIYVARDPVARAVSQYGHSWSMGLIKDRPDHFYDSHEYHHILDASRYAAQLGLYLDHFAPEAILVLDFDELVSTPQSALDKVHAHIGARPMKLEAAVRSNDTAGLSRIPPSVLRLTSGPLRPLMLRFVGRPVRQFVKRVLSVGPQRLVPVLPEHVTERMRDALAADAAEFRRLTGMTFPRWVV